MESWISRESDLYSILVYKYSGGIKKLSFI